MPKKTDKCNFKTDGCNFIGLIFIIFAKVLICSTKFKQESIFIFFNNFTIMRFKIFPGFLIFLSLLVSCNHSPLKTIYDVLPESNIINIQKLDSAISFELKTQSETAYSNSKFIKQWYLKHKFQSVWINSSQNSSNIEVLLSYISHIEDHGLNPDQFEIKKLSTLVEQMKKNKLTYTQLSELEITLSKTYLQYCGGLEFGFVNPKETCINYFIPTQTVDFAFTEGCLNAVNLKFSDLLASIQPTSKTYRALQNEKKKYSDLIDSTFTPIPLLLEKETIKLGTSHTSIPLIARRLMITGELPFDSSYQATYLVFDKKLLNALNIFRIKTGQLLDTEIGNHTINALNTTFAQYVQKININLERLRWKPATSIGSKYIRVNVADFTLSAYRNDTVRLTMKVVVGKPPKTLTPFLQSKLFELVINPTWTVPNSIIIKEISKTARTDTTYFSRKNIRVYEHGVEINPNNINWAKVSEKYQPYKLVQESGSENSLGRIKFNFGNPFSVYLHDTNLKSAFNLQNRALSHGCVRVEKPLELASFCLPDIKPANTKQIENRNLLIDKIRYSIDLNVLSEIGKECIKANSQSMIIKNVKLKTYIPVIIDYQTCFLTQKNKVQFKDDIYKMDSVLNKRLKEIR
jgi:L,D-transpeptidase YcbB